MTDNIKIQKSMLEQIYDELITNLADKENFDAELIKKLKELSISGEIKRPTTLQSILKQ